MTPLNTHPYYDAFIDEWTKFRLVFEGGSSYVTQYLKRFSDAEEESDFQKRKDITYRPNHAKRAILKVRDALFQRMTDVKREGGSATYVDAVAGKNGGVNRRGMSMSAYLGLKILPELLSMGKCYVYVDKEPIEPNQEGKITVAAAVGKVPYLYLYKVEDVISWVCGNASDPNEFTAVMLRDWKFKTDDATGLPVGETERYRKLWVKDGRVYCQFYDENMIAEPETKELNLTRIPLVLFEIHESLMTDIADYQIALLNLVSSDMAYLLSANIPTYIEQYDPRFDAVFQRGPQVNTTTQVATTDANGNVVTPAGTQRGTGTAADANTAQNRRIRIGGKYARQYSTDQAPEYIHPSTDPVKASMAKQDQLINEIDRLVNLTLENLSITGEAKKQERSGLEAGLSTIGLVLQTGEVQIASYWADYEGGKSAIVTYPSDYSLKSDGERIKDCNDLIELKNAVPSPTFARQVSKKIARTLFDARVAPEVQASMDKEIEDAEYTTSDPDTLATAHQEGAIDAVMMAKALGFKNPEALAKRAQEEQAKRLATIAVHQQAAAGARGVADMQNTNDDGKNEKKLSKQSSKVDKNTKSQAQ